MSIIILWLPALSLKYGESTIFLTKECGRIRHLSMVAMILFLSITGSAFRSFRECAENSILYIIDQALFLFALGCIFYQL